MEMDSLATAIDTMFGWSGKHLGEFKIKSETPTLWRLEGTGAGEMGSGEILGRENQSRVGPAFSAEEVSSRQ